MRKNIPASNLHKCFIHEENFYRASTRRSIVIRRCRAMDLEAFSLKQSATDKDVIDSKTAAGVVSCVIAGAEMIAHRGKSIIWSRTLASIHEPPRASEMNDDE